MARWYFTLFFAFFSLFASQPTNAINQTELQSALTDMRTTSYNGFVILLQMLNSDPMALRDIAEITFLMPDDVELSNAVLSVGHLREFLLSHAFPTTLPLVNLMHLPTGTVIPSAFPNKTIMITNHGRLNYFVNNAKIIRPNLCASALIKCHGVANIMRFDDVQVSFVQDDSDAPDDSSVDEPDAAPPFQ